MGIRDYKEKPKKENKGRFDKMVEAEWDPSDVVDNAAVEKDTVEFNINALVEKPTERKKSYSYTLKPSQDEKVKKLAEEKGYSNKSSFMSAIIDGLPDPRK